MFRCHSFPIVARQFRKIPWILQHSLGRGGNQRRFHVIRAFRLGINISKKHSIIRSACEKKKERIG